MSTATALTVKGTAMTANSRNVFMAISRGGEGEDGTVGSRSDCGMGAHGGDAAFPSARNANAATGCNRSRAKGGAPFGGAGRLFFALGERAPCNARQCDQGEVERCNESEKKEESHGKRIKNVQRAQSRGCELGIASVVWRSASYRLPTNR